MQRYVPFWSRAFFALWEVAPRVGWVQARDLPPLTTVVPVLWALLQQPRFIADIGYTALEAVIAFAVVAPLALGVGFFLGENRRAERMFGPTLNMMIAVPKSVFLPVFILALGIGLTQKVVFAMSPCVLRDRAEHDRGRSLDSGHADCRGTLVRRRPRPNVHPHLCAGDGAGGAGWASARHGPDHVRGPVCGNVCLLGWSRPQHLRLGRTRRDAGIVRCRSPDRHLTVLLNEGMQGCENFSRKRFSLELGR